MRNTKMKKTTCAIFTEKRAVTRPYYFFLPKGEGRNRRSKGLN